jgi:hypothetical protein
MAHFGTRPLAGPPVGPGGARAMPRAWVTAQARPGTLGRAGMGPVAIGPCRVWARPKLRATGRATGPRAA